MLNYYYYLSFAPEIIYNRTFFDFSMTKPKIHKNESSADYISRYAIAAEKFKDGPIKKFYFLKSDPNIIFMRYKLKTVIEGKYVELPRYILLDRDSYNIVIKIPSMHHVDYGKIRCSYSFAHESTSCKTVLCKANNKDSEEYATHHLGHNFDNRKNSLLVLKSTIHDNVKKYEKNIITRGGELLIISDNFDDFISSISAPNYPIIPQEIQENVSQYRDGKLI